MEIGAMLDELREKALKDRNIWQELMDTRKAEQPLAAFCAKCRELGYQIYEMDLITAGEEFYATMRSFRFLHHGSSHMGRSRSEQSLFLQNPSPV